MVFQCSSSVGVHELPQPSAQGRPKLALVRESYETGKPIPRVQVHKVPDYVYFNHSVHVNRGFSCVECHGPVNEMDEVYHAKPFGMSFCLECHRQPEERIRPLDKITDLD